ncbi:MAG: serine/threonine protein kinase [Sandaracinaceae bacterium]|nr:serine/threonine protein kinase [Sandaracinaceae bacterium]
MLSPGTIIGDKYRLEAPIGQGGMATVWRAVHTTLDRPVAVKFLEAVGTHAQQLAARFLREAKLAAGIRHRHVVDIVDFGVTDSGQPFMVMELLEGKSLADRYELGPRVTDWDLIEIVAMTLGGLAAVHDAGILHRDIKPENLFLVEDADGTYPKLIDFGVSKGFQHGDRITRTGAVVGTPEYMSPEQARGLKEIGPASDLWAMGIVLYEGLVGRTPFESENPGDVLIAIATAELPSLADARPDLPPALVEVVHRTLAKRPEDRFADARAMREALHAVMQSDLPIEGRPDGRGSFEPAPGSGLIRVLTKHATPPPSMPSSPEIAIPLTPKLPHDAAARPPAPKPKKASKPTPTTDPRALAAPRASRPTPAPAPRRGGLGWALALLVLAGGGVAAFLLLDGEAALERAGLFGMGIADESAQGALRPGLDVSALSDASPRDAHADPPPGPDEDPDAPETVDVPSPPDPPAGAGELEGTEPTGDAGETAPGEAAPGEAAPGEAAPRPRDDRRPPRRPSRRLRRGPGAPRTAAGALAAARRRDSPRLHSAARGSRSSNQSADNFSCIELCRSRWRR